MCPPELVRIPTVGIYRTGICFDENEEMLDEMTLVRIKLTFEFVSVDDFRHEFS